jgi:hypothetical protein
MEKRHLVIVDPVSSGGLLARRSSELFDVIPLAVISRERLPAALTASYHSEDFAGEVWFRSFEQVIKEVESLCGGAPDYIMCGAEPGVELFDRLASFWQLLPNNPATSSARRDKYLMQHSLQEAGLAYIPHFKSGDLGDIEWWCNSRDGAEFVVKPLKSSASEGVYFCRDAAEVRRACVRLLGNTDYLGSAIDEVLVEERLYGPEIVVDTVSSYGQHFTVGMFLYAKDTQSGSPLYRSMEAIDISSRGEITDYVDSALSALGVLHGPTHNEVVLTARGPVLMETGARMHGGQGARLVERAFSHSLIDLSIASRISPECFAAATRSPSILVQSVVECFLSNGTDGLVVVNNVSATCGTLDSYVYDTCRQAAGDRVVKTVDLMTSYGRVVLANPSPEKLAADLSSVLRADEQGKLLTVVPAAG